MGKGNKKHTDMYRSILLWYTSFIPLGIVAVLGVLCFLYETEIWLYVVCGALLLLWVMWYVIATKKITHKDGYTLIQAMSFFLLCKKNDIHTIPNKAERNAAMLQLAKQTDYAVSLKLAKIRELYQIGAELANHFQARRQKNDV